MTTRKIINTRRKELNLSRSLLAKEAGGYYVMIGMYHQRGDNV